MVQGKSFFPLKTKETELSSLLNAQKLALEPANLVPPGWLGLLRMMQWEPSGTSALGKQWQHRAQEGSSTSPHYFGLKGFCSCSQCVLEWTGWGKVPSSGMDSLFLAQQSLLFLPGILAQDLIKSLLNQEEMRFLCTGIVPSTSISREWLAELAMVIVWVCLSQGHLQWGYRSTWIARWHQKKGWSGINAL